MVLLRVLIVTCVASFLACQVAAQATSPESATGVLDRILEQTDDDIIPIQTENGQTAHHRMNEKKQLPGSQRSFVAVRNNNRIGLDPVIRVFCSDDD